MSVSRSARRLLAEARAEESRLERHLLVAAALRALLEGDPIVVGGTAEEYWTQDAYHQTDLDLCVALSAADEASLIDAGFRKEGRHWVLDAPVVAVEFPESRIDGDESRTVLQPVGTGAARIIGLDDLYLDRLRQATMREGAEQIEYHSALAVAAANREAIDWGYVDDVIATTFDHSEVLGAAMRRIDERIRRRVRRRAR